MAFQHMIELRKRGDIHPGFTQNVERIDARRARAMAGKQPPHFARIPVFARKQGPFGNQPSAYPMPQKHHQHRAVLSHDLRLVIFGKGSGGAVILDPHRHVQHIAQHVVELNIGPWRQPVHDLAPVAVIAQHIAGHCHAKTEELASHETVLRGQNAQPLIQRAGKDARIGIGEGDPDGASPPPTLRPG
ncbi:hypothetical protein E4T56_gene8467, partial [Termitomyces sp. T112]